MSSCFDLLQGAWVPVEQESPVTVRLGQAVTHHGVGDLVRDVLAGVHVGLGGDTQLGARGDVGAEDVVGEIAGIP